MFNYNFLLVLLIIITLILLIINCFKKNNFKNLEKISRFLLKENIKVSVIISGFAPRSFKYTYKSIKNNIIEVLNNNNFVTDVYHHSLITRNNILNTYREGENNIKINNNDVYLLDCKKTITEYQEDIDIPYLLNCKMYKGYLVDKDKYNYDVTKNHYRALYSEFKCINEFPIYNYDVCILLSSDSLIKKKINIYEILNCKINKNIIYTTKFNKSSNFFANGFYISTPNNLEIICNRIKLFNNYCYKVQNAEEFLSIIMKNNKIKNKYSKMFYIKVRADGSYNWYKNV
jgi:hypothetical protein